MRVWLTERFRSPTLSRRYERIRLTHRFAAVTLHLRTNDVPSNAIVTASGAPLVSASGAYLVGS